MQEVQIDPMPLERLAGFLDADRAARLAAYAERARTLLSGRTVWNVNATATGGGVAEMLQGLLAYARGARVETRWLVLDGSAEFFQLTKRIHNLLHGSDGDGGPLGERERELYESVLADNLSALRERVRPGDVVLLHDPQTAGMVDGPSRERAPTSSGAATWASTRPPSVTDAGVGVPAPLRRAGGRGDLLPRWSTSRDWVDRSPGLADPALPRPVQRQERRPGRGRPGGDPAAGRPGGHPGGPRQPRLRAARRVARPACDGTPGSIAGGQIVPADARVVLQVSRWDRLKDMAGVLTGFADHLDELADDVHLMLVGPDVSGVSDDPEGAEVLEECLSIWECPARGGAAADAPVQPADGRHRRERPPRQRPAAPRHRRGAEEPRRGLRAHRHRADVEGHARWSRPGWAASRTRSSTGSSGLLLDDPPDLDGFAAQLTTPARRARGRGRGSARPPASGSATSTSATDT